MMTLRLLLCLAACVGLAAAADITISAGASASKFRNTIKKAADGDVITVEPGSYTFTSTININCNDCTIQAAPGGEVFVSGGIRGFRFYGDRITFKGFSFVEGGGDKASRCTLLDIRGSHTTISDCNFDGYNSKKYVNIDAGTQYNVVTKCNFANRPVDVLEGNLVQVNADASVIGYHTISYCSFQNIDGDCDVRRAAGFTGACSLGDFGNEPIRLGLGTQHFPLAATVEYNYFENVGKADGETISIKSNNNVLRYNTFNNNPQGMMVFRSGDDNVAYGNFFINSGGVRIKEENNVWIYDNYFDQSGCDKSLCAPPFELNPVKGYTTGIVVAYNTFHKCERLKLGKDKWDDDVEEAAVFVNNIFSSPSERKIFRDDNKKTTFRGNMVNVRGGEASNGDARYTASGLTEDLVDGIAEVLAKDNSDMEANADGVFGPAEGSPAIDAATTDVPFVADMAALDFDQDMDEDVFGQARGVGEGNDVGAVEFGANDDPDNAPLTLADVGPDFLRGRRRAVGSTASTAMTVGETEAAAMRDFGEVTMDTIEAEATMAKFGVRVLAESQPAAVSAAAPDETVMVQTAAQTQATHFTAVVASAGVAVLVLAAVAIRKTADSLPTSAPGDGNYGTHGLQAQ